VTDSAPTVIEGSAEISATARQLVEVARHELCWISFKLDRRLYGNEDFSDAVKRIVLGDPRNRIRVLVNQAQEAARSGCPRIVDLAQAVPSRMELRRIPEEMLADWRCEWLLADGRTLFERHHPEAISARYWHDAPFEGSRMLKEFDALWHAAEPALEFRRLSM